MLAFTRQAGRSRVTLSGALFAGLLLALSLAASPQLHELIHHDGAAEQHECLAYTLQTGGSEAVPLVVITMRPLGEHCVSLPVWRAEHPESFFLTCRRLEHAPPRTLPS